MASAYSIVTGDELDRIRTQVRPNPIESSQAEKERLKGLSDDRASKWPNTIEAQRARKERARKERLEQEERERCEVDRQEALLKAENRRQQIDRANKMLYDETDRVKAFHSRLLLSDVLQEREQQIEYRKELVDISKRQEDAFVKAQAQAIEIAEHAELEKLEEKRQRAYQQRDAQLEQLEVLKARIRTEREQDKEEGLMLKKKAEEEVIAMQEKAIERHQRLKYQNEEVEKANRALQKMKVIERERELDEERKIAEFAQKKEEMILERKLREEAKIREKAVARDTMVKRMEDDLLQRREESEKRLLAQVNDIDMKEEALDQAAKEYRHLEKLAIDRSRQQQMQIKKAQKERSRADDLEMHEQMKIRNEMMKMEEEEQRVATFARNKKLQAAHVRQMDKKRLKSEREKAEEMADAEATRLILAEDDELFKQYTGVCMEEWHLQGKTLKPMQLEITKKEKLIPRTQMM
mmetsp:Transcript_23816/g.28747  ORF Transcript_23816/g.28747 Transcript_23816/m.28747 type:complete len:467 (-) Transcript_23816:593-1993(-)|eukprot:CAMPEP_0197854128 /NCGR_PEP_ID=MMETSP1438-20131217/24080_1 /TAXON_ID=1461541 /ORGANISM="Pterosperma sp., Strain CCMP1384" /LENGTH=466 /DNA_ID=CAMNT_0043468775 /DNA_START=241 /DNA_END=1641 /DNA_ORIENTATION=+